MWAKQGLDPWPFVQVQCLGPQLGGKRPLSEAFWAGEKISALKPILFDILGMNPRFNIRPLPGGHALNRVCLGKSPSLSESVSNAASLTGGR